MGLKLILSVYLLLSVVSVNRALAQESDINLLTYSELMQLPAEKRVQYIEDVQKMLTEISKSPGRFSDSDPQSRSRLKVWLELMQTQINSAQAADDGIPRCEHEATGKCSTAMAKCDQKDFDVKWDGKAYVCDTSKKIVRGNLNRQDSFVERQKGRNDPRVEANSTKEVLPVQIGTTAVPEASVPTFTGGVATRGLVLNKRAPSATIEDYVRVQSESGSLPCRSVHQSASPAGSRELPECTPAGEAAIKSAFEKQQSKIGAILSATAGESSAPSPSAKPLVAELAAAVAAPVPVAEPAAAAEAVTAPFASGTASFPVAPPVKIVALEIAGSPVKTTGKEISPEISQDEIRKLLLEKRHPEFLCIEEAKKAGTGKMNLVEFEGTNRRYCMTEKGEQLYRSKKWRPKGVDDRLPSSREELAAISGKPKAPAPAATALSCAPKPVVCPDPKVSKAQAFAGNQKCVFAGMLSKLDNRNRKCEAILEFKLSDATYKCDAGQAMCNPLLFGSVSPTKPICVGRGQDATLQCSKLSSARDAEKFINRNTAGLQEKWDEFGRELKSLCKADTVSAKFHCAECNIMQMRIFEMNARAIASAKGDPCSPASIGTDAVGARIKSRSITPAQEKKTGR